MINPKSEIRNPKQIQISKFKFLKLALCFVVVVLFSMQGYCASIDNAKDRLDLSKYEKVKIIASTYYAHLWSDTGRYRRVSKHGKRLGDFVALNFLPGGSVIMIPELFKTTTLEVADTFGGVGYRTYKGKKYWKVDILRNKGEYYDDFDYPLDMYIIKMNKCGEVKNSSVRQNCINFRSLGKEKKVTPQVPNQ